MCRKMAVGWSCFAQSFRCVRHMQQAMSHSHQPSRFPHRPSTVAHFAMRCSLLTTCVFSRSCPHAAHSTVLFHSHTACTFVFSKHIQFLIGLGHLTGRLFHFLALEVCHTTMRLWMQLPCRPRPAGIFPICLCFSTLHTSIDYLICFRS